MSHPQRFSACRAGLAARGAARLAFGLALAAMASAAAAQDAGEPGGLGFSGRIQREVKRQHTVGQGMGRIIDRLGELTADLRSNGFLDHATERDILTISGKLRNVNDQHVRAAVMELGKALDDLAKASGPLGAADKEVEAIMRQLQALLMRASAAQARALLISELRDIILKQEVLHRQTIAWGQALFQNATAAADQIEPLAGAQKQIADRVEQFMGSVLEARKTDTDAINTLRLTQVHSLLTEKKVHPLLLGTVADIQARRPVETVGKQKQALAILREAERVLQPDQELNVLNAAVAELKKIRGDQGSLRTHITDSPAAQFAVEAKDLQLRQRDLGSRLGKVEVSLAGLSAREQAAAPPPWQQPIAEAMTQMQQAEGSIQARKVPEATGSQKHAEEALTRAIAALEARIDELMKAAILAQQLAEARRRLETLLAMEALQRQLLKDTTEAHARKKTVIPIAAPQGQLAERVKQFHDTLPPGIWTALMKIPLATATEETAQAAIFLGKDVAPTAIPHQEKALEALIKAREVAEKEVAALMKQLEAAISADEMKQLAARIGEMGNQQKAISDETQQRKNENKSVQSLMQVQQALREAAGQAATAMPMDQSIQRPLNQAGEAMAGAAQQLGANMPSLASPYQKQAAEALSAAQRAASEGAEQAGMLGEWQAMLASLRASILSILQRQRELREQTEKEKLRLLPDLGGEQRILEAEAASAGEDSQIIGAKQYTQAAAAMKEAVKFLAASNRDEAVKYQKLAEKALEDAEKAVADAQQALQEAGELAEAGRSEAAEPQEPSNQLNALTRALILASRQRTLRQKTRQTPQDKDLPQHAAPQGELRSEADSLAGAAEFGAEHVQTAAGEMRTAVGFLNKSQRKPAVTDQEDAEIALRKAIIAMATELAAQMAGPPTPSPAGLVGTGYGRGNPGDGDRQFLRTDPWGDDPGKGKAQWRPLGEREREALNENFARELPMEYRRLLEDYYEALSK